ncbi:MAG: AMP-binding protein [Rhodospirillales bacterium]|nr:MAG: AMP-binding protein [Rhodospirillales bacterium]
MPPREAVVTRDLIDENARRIPDKVFVRFEDGSSWTYAGLRERVVQVATGFQALGVEQGDFVLSWLANGPHALAVWFGLNYIGAIYVPVNTAYRGSLLRHVIADSRARLMVADARLAPRLAEIDVAGVRQVICIGAEAPAIDGIEVLGESVLAPMRGELAAPERPIQPWDTQAVIYTSGTTGPSKGVLSSYLHIHSTGRAYPIGPEDRTLVNIPLFHASGTGAVYRMLMHGGSIAMVEAFNTYTFWDTVRATGATTLTLLGAMTPFLMKEPPGDRDRDHTLRKVTMVPLGDDSAAFTERFGVDVYTAFNMTETSCPIFSDRNPRKRGTCGRPRAGVEVRIVDGNDCEVPVGAIGELMIRTEMPWAMNHGYHNNPEATARAWRNGWFHSGDAFRRDADGDYFFVDRMKDAIRRRGENISSFEVEAEICAHPDVREAAVVAAASEFNEDEVLAIVAPVEGRTLDPVALIDFLAGRLPHFMVPRYLRIVPELPKTPTHKVQKHLLRGDGVTEDTWDREKAGIVFKRQALR